MNKIGIKIDLSTFFEDERKMSIIMVDPSWKNVESLQKRVEYLFEVDSVRFLNSEGYFLPPQESIEILKFCKGLKAFVPKESLEKRKKKKSKKSQSVEKSLHESDGIEYNYNTDICGSKEIQKKRKYFSLESGFIANSTPNRSKRLKNCSSIPEKVVQSKHSNKSSEITSTSEHMPPPQCLDTEVDENKLKGSINFNSEHCKLGKSSQELICEDGTKEHKENSEDEETSFNNNTVNERKKSIPGESFEITEIGEKSLQIAENEGKKTCNSETKSFVACPSSVPSSTFLNDSKMSEQCKNSPNFKNPFKRQSSNTKHIYFNKYGENVTTTSEKSFSKPTPKEDNETNTVVIFRCALGNVTNNVQTSRPRIFKLNSKSKTNEINKQVVEIQEEIILHPNPMLINSTTTEPIADTAKEQKNMENSKNCNTNNITGNTTIGENPNPTSSADNLEVSKIEDVEITKSEDESLLHNTNVNESSIMSVDCVDLSIDVDEEGEIDKKSKKKILSKKSEEKHDLTLDDRDNVSSSDVEEISEIIDLNETEDYCDRSTSLSNDIRVHKILPFCTDILNLPNIGDIIVFKIPVLNNKQQYMQTNYLAGRTEYINKRTKTIKMLIVDGIAELCHVPNRYHCNLDDSQNHGKYLQLKLNEMVSPKLFSMDSN